MKKNKPARPGRDALRDEAEKRLSNKLGSDHRAGNESEVDLKSVIYELEVHQIELEMQNETLRSARAEAEESRAGYLELFDFAPIGHLTLDEWGFILDVNLAAAGMFGSPKSFLTGKAFVKFLPASSRAAFAAFLSEVNRSREKQSCELSLVGTGSEPVFAHMEGIFIQVHEKAAGRIQIALIDVTERRRAEAAREALLRELTQTLATVKRLKSLLPICASCKRIRDDQGYWQEVEKFISEHSEAEFSHGICPECSRRLYPEFNKT